MWPYTKEENDSLSQCGCEEGEYNSYKEMCEHQEELTESLNQNDEEE